MSIFSWIGKAYDDSSKWIGKATKDTQKWVGKASHDVGNFFKNTKNLYQKSKKIATDTYKTAKKLPVIGDMIDEKVKQGLDYELPGGGTLKDYDKEIEEGFDDAIEISDKTNKLSKAKDLSEAIRGGKDLYDSGDKMKTKYKKKYNKYKSKKNKK